MKSYGIDLQISYKDVKSIIRFIEIYSNLGLPKEFRLTKKELVYFANIVVFWNINKKVTDYDLSNNLPFISGISKTNRGIYIYKHKLLKKKWLIQLDSGYDIPGVLKNNNNHFELKLLFKNEDI